MVDKDFGTQQKRQPRLGFLGVGWIGKNRMMELHDRQLSDTCAMCDIDRRKVDESLKNFPQAKVYENYGDLLNEDIDGVVIATPSAFHAEQAIQALQNGKSVFCQKPLGRNAAEVISVVEEAKNSNKLLEVDYSYKYTEGIQKIKERMEKGELGEIFSVEAVFHNAYGPDKDWFYDPKLSGGGCLMDLGSHLVDLILFLFDDPNLEVQYANILSNGKKIENREVQVEDFAEAQLISSNGMSVRLACSWKLSVGKDADISLKVYGSKAGATFKNVEGSFYDFRADIHRQNHTENLSQPPEKWGGKAIENWAERLAIGDSYCNTNKQLIHSAEILENIYNYAMS